MWSVNPVAFCPSRSFSLSSTQWQMKKLPMISNIAMQLSFPFGCLDVWEEVAENSTVEQILVSGMRADTMDMKWMKRGFVMNHHRRVKQRRKNAKECNRPKPNAAIFLSEL
jgi:hypothetical protein